MKTPLAILAISLTVLTTGCSTLLPGDTETIPTSAPEATTPVAALVYPIADFPTRVTLKPFGIHITPDTSPVQPERFSGYHTGDDAETTDEEADTEIPVLAIADGKVALARSATGYGGVLVLQFTLDGQPYTAVYGHLNVDSFTVQVDDTVTVGQTLAFLGQGYSTQTDGERKHLHFGLLPGTSTNIKGYVQTESALSEWLDPVEFFEEHLTW